ncbi:sce7726 family protein [Roseivirga thermotolerans]|uniref:Sce7726 family protein n=1 Tax=Roseivirga thermotolerans TaxID=1758176 RepID=A0ABQ3I2R5_9BACT|nr:sce7726 family protein [Roseivirga thermotolerans]GHE52230.1 hypothetical protein GCM10011340_03080 [Roseivirga thermotolerans]
MRDPEIRKVLRNSILKDYLSDPNSKVVEELRLNPASAQIDIAVLNGSIHAFEIKSASDTLNRLPSQLEAYSKVCDYISIVTEVKYVKKIMAMVPDWIGVTQCDDTGCQIMRKPQRNSLIQGFYLAQLLRIDEIKQLLVANGVVFNHGRRKWYLSELLANSLAVQDLSNQVRLTMKSREGWKEDSLNLAH